LLKEAKGGGDREAEAPRIARQQRKSIMLIETLGGCILGIHQESENAQLRTRRSQNGIRQESST
jgi:hypothetical protein